MKSVCILVQSPYELDIRVRRKAEALVAAGYSVDVLALRSSSTRKTFTLNGVNVQTISLGKKRGSLARYAFEYVAFFLWAFVRVLLQMRRRRYAVIDVNTLPDFLVFASAFARWKGAKLILDMHEITPEFYISKYGIAENSWVVRFLKHLEKISFDFADHVITINEPIQDLLVYRGLPQSKSTVIMNAVDEARFAHASSSSADVDSAAAPGRFVMMYHGTLTEIYGLELAIEGFGMVHNEMPGAELWILGDGPEKGLLESLTQERGLASKVRLVGHVLPTEVPTWLDKCDIGVLPMRRDIFLEFAFPNKLSEYIIMGKAVLIPRLKAIRHYFSEEALAYFEPNNPADLAKQMVCLYRDGGLRARLAARAKEEYAPIRWDVMRQRYLRLIEDMVGPGHRTAGREASQYTYVLITPARNEAKFIELTIKSVVGQTIRPAKWVIVSDGSTDGTDDIVSKYAAEHRWIELVRMPERRERHFAGKVHAFNSGYARMTDMKYDVIGSLDGDISLEDEDYFSFLLSKFAEDPTLGLVGTPYKGRSTYDYRFVSIDYVSGACQLFRRECFEEIGGYVPVKEGGVDDIAVITARMKGWKTRTFTDKMCLHHREHGSAEHSALMARFRDGALDYALGGHPVWELFRTVYQMTKRPVVVGGLTLLAGYVWAMVRRVHRPVSRELVEFHRREQMRRLWKFLTGNRSPRNHALQHPLDGADAGGG